MPLEHYADIHAQCDSGEVALHLATCFSQINIMWSLLDHGADVNARDNEGSTPLHHSSQRRPDRFLDFTLMGSVEGTRLLLEHASGANIDSDAENNKGETPFQVAMAGGRHEMVVFLWGLGTMYS